MPTLLILHSTKVCPKSLFLYLVRLNLKVKAKVNSNNFKGLRVQGTCMPTSLYLAAHQPAKQARLLDLASSHTGLA